MSIVTDLKGLSRELRSLLDQSGTGKRKVVFSNTNTVAFGDTTAKTLFTLPANARILNVVVDVDTAFNSSGTDLLSVGTIASNTRYFTALDVSATGRKAPTITNMGTVGTADLVIVGIYAQSVADATTGQATITLTWTAS